MSWVKDALVGLEQNGVADIRPLGHSMRGKIESGQLVTLGHIQGEEARKGDVVFIKWKGNYLLHLVKKVGPDRLLIGNNLGKINGWIPKENVLGRVTSIHDYSRT